MRPGFQRAPLTKMLSQATHCRHPEAGILRDLPRALACSQSLRMRSRIGTRMSRVHPLRYERAHPASYIINRNALAPHRSSSASAEGYLPVFLLLSSLSRSPLRRKHGAQSEDQQDELAVLVSLTRSRENLDASAHGRSFFARRQMSQALLSGLSFSLPRLRHCYFLLRMSTEVLKSHRFDASLSLASAEVGAGFAAQ